MSDMNNIESKSASPISKVIELSAFKKKQETKNEISRNRKPLYVNEASGAVTGRPNAPKQDGKNGDFADRLVKIRGSLDRINQLMSEIKKLSAKESSHS